MVAPVSGQTYFSPFALKQSIMEFSAFSAGRQAALKMQLTGISQAGRFIAFSYGLPFLRKEEGLIYEKQSAPSLSMIID